MHELTTGEDERVAREVGRRIRALRNGPPAVTQEVLGARAGISVSFLSMIERGQRVPHVLTLVALAKALGVGVEALLTDAPAGRKAPEAMVELDAFIAARKLQPADVERLLELARVLFPEARE